MAGGQATTPRIEWLHVAEPDKAPDLPKGVDHEGNDLGLREKVDPNELHRTMLDKIKISFYEIGWKENADALTQEKLDAMDVLLPEVVGLRCYTGPLFMIYNAVLRALGKNKGIVGFGNIGRQVIIE